MQLVGAICCKFTCELAAEPAASVATPAVKADPAISGHGGSEDGFPLVVAAAATSVTAAAAAAAPAPAAAVLLDADVIHRKAAHTKLFTAGSAKTHDGTGEDDVLSCVVRAGHCAMHIVGQRMNQQLII